MQRELGRTVGEVEDEAHVVVPVPRFTSCRGGGDGVDVDVDRLVPELGRQDESRGCDSGLLLDLAQGRGQKSVVVRFDVPAGGEQQSSARLVADVQDPPAPVDHYGAARDVGRKGGAVGRLGASVQSCQQAGQGVPFAGMPFQVGGDHGTDVREGRRHQNLGAEGTSVSRGTGSGSF